MTKPATHSSTSPISLGEARPRLHDAIDEEHDSTESVVLRYRGLFRSEEDPDEDARFKGWLKQTSIREGARIFHLLSYRGVELFVLDETSLMHTRTMRSLDGCVNAARCRYHGYDRVVFESGGNSGSATSAYGRRAGVETFLFVPEENLPLLVGEVFEPEHTHLIAVEEPGLVKEAGKLFYTVNGLEHIPQGDWRYEASRFRGAFMLEWMLRHSAFDWITQTISAAFGPIGFYQVLHAYADEIGAVPRFLGIQQEANCPMYRAWKANTTTVDPIEIHSTDELLTRILYDVRPHTYGTGPLLHDLLLRTRGDLTTLNHDEFDAFLNRAFDGRDALRHLADHGVDVTVRDGQVVEKTGLMALAGTFKGIDRGLIAPGSRVLCCLTSGMSQADGRAVPDVRLGRERLEETLRAYSDRVLGRRAGDHAP